jgi:hypothetical protein
MVRRKQSSFVKLQRARAGDKLQMYKSVKSQDEMGKVAGEVKRRMVIEFTVNRFTVNFFRFNVLPVGSALQ